MHDSEYFKCLPTDIYEHVVKSGKSFNTEQELRNFIGAEKPKILRERARNK